MTRTKLLSNSSARSPLTVLAVLLLLLGLAFPGTARAQNGPQIQCIPGLELPADLAELDLEGLQAALRELVEADPEATVTLLVGGEEVATVRADLLLADGAVLVALIEGQPLNVTAEFPQGDEGLAVIVAIEVFPAEGCTDESCVKGFELPAALADLDVAGLRLALEEIIAADADATVTLLEGGEEVATVRADLLIGLSDPVLGAVLAGDLLGMFVVFEGETAEIVGIALPSPECERTAGPPDAEPTVVPIPDNQQDGGKDTTPDNQQGGGDKVPDNQQTDDKDTGADGKTPDNQQGGGEGLDNQQEGDEGTGAGDEQQEDVQDDQQGELPEELPDTGAGGLASGTSIPGGKPATGLTMLLGAGYAVLRRSIEN